METLSALTSKFSHVPSIPPFLWACRRRCWSIQPVNYRSTSALISFFAALLARSATRPSTRRRCATDCSPRSVRVCVYRWWLLCQSIVGDYRIVALPALFSGWHSNGLHAKRFITSPSASVRAHTNQSMAIQSSVLGWITPLMPGICRYWMYSYERSFITYIENIVGLVFD